MKEVTPETSKFTLGEKKPMRNNLIKKQFETTTQPQHKVEFKKVRTEKVGNDIITIYNTPFGEMISSADLRAIVAYTMPREKYVYSSLFRMYNNHINNYEFSDQTNMIVHEGVYYFNINAFQCITERFREVDGYEEMDWNKLQQASEKVYGTMTSEVESPVTQTSHVELKPLPIESITSIIGKEHKRTSDENMALNAKIRNGLKQNYGDIKEIDDTYIAIMAYGYNSFDAYRELLPILDARVHSPK
jgi:hypothetical protein